MERERQCKREGEGVSTERGVGLWFMSNVVLSLPLSWLQYGYDYGMKMEDDAFEDYRLRLTITQQKKINVNQYFCL